MAKTNYQTDNLNALSENIETLDFEPIKGYPMLNWRGKRPFTSTHFYPAQLKEQHGSEVDGWLNKIYWGDNLQVMSHLLKHYRGKVDLVYIDPPFDSKADYNKQIKLRGNVVASDASAFEEKQYGDIWTNDEYLQFMYERLVLIRELLSDRGGVYLHCDYRKVHQLRCIMDEVFGVNHFLNSLVWMFSTRSAIRSTWKRSHHDILFYKKNADPIFNWDDDMVIEPLSEATIKKYKLQDENGPYRLNGRNIKGSPIRSAKDVDAAYEKTNPEWVVRDYLRDGKVASDFFFIDIENQSSLVRTNYPTQKPEELLAKLISASTQPGDLVFDCFMGSGTTQALAMKLGRRFLGADINLGAIQTTTKRLIEVAEDIKAKQNGPAVKPLPPTLNLDDEPEEGSEGEAEGEAPAAKPQEPTTFYTGFEVYNVNNYEIFRNPVQAKDLLIEALELQKLQAGHLFDGERDGRLWKIMPVNKIATRQDLNEIISGLNLKTLAERHLAAPSQPVEKITLVCMGHEPDLAATLNREVALSLNVKAGTRVPLDVEVLDILRDRNDLQFKRDSEAKVTVQGGQVVIESFYPMNLLSKLSLQKEKVGDWREMVDSVMVDFNYDGAVFNPGLVDIPEKNGLVVGSYAVPEDAGTIRVKITDVLSESLEMEVRG